MYSIDDQGVWHEIIIDSDPTEFNDRLERLELDPYLNL